MPSPIPAPDPITPSIALGALQARLATLREDLRGAEREFVRRAPPLSDEARRSAVNLVHYLELRRHDLRPLQEELTRYGLSSLGRAESHVLASLDAILAVLDRTASRDGVWSGEPAEPPLSGQEGREFLEGRADALFGPRPSERSVRVMVTLPDEAPERYELVRDLLANGMDCLRINCAHGETDECERAIANVRRAEEELGKPCSILMDLPGPRARTGAIEPGPRVVKIRPQRDALGRVTREAEVWLVAEDHPAPPPRRTDAVIPLPPEFLSSLGAGDRLVFRDARGARRTLRVRVEAGGERWGSLAKTTYVTTGAVMIRVSAVGVRHGPRRAAVVGRLPPIEQRIRLAPGDHLVLTRDQTPGTPALRDDAGRVKTPARIPCTPPEVLRNLRPGEPIWFDEGRIGGTVESVAKGEVVVAITTAAPEGSKLAAGKAMNFPESDLGLPSLTARDLELLPFIAARADLVGYSFVRTAADVEELFRRLTALPVPQPGVVLKIETARAFQELPEILLAALRHPPVGVMIARGDLAVECGFPRLAEVQEEILWLCEAAHLPVIWATQVLESLAHDGRPSRAEVTDAAVAERAECVMLNKGPYIVDAVRALGSILERMQDHQDKKRSLLRELRVADRFQPR